VIIAIVVILVFLAGPFYVLEEGEQAIVIRFGEIVSSTADAGLKLKAPVVDTVVRFPERILSWDGDPRRVPTAENQFIWVDTTGRWRISDPALFYESVQTLEGAFGRLDGIMDSSVRTTIAENSLSEAVRNSNVIFEIEREQAIPDTEVVATEEDGDASGFVEELESLVVTDIDQPRVRKGRRTLANEMFESAAAVTPDFGIELIDLVVRQIRYSEELTQSVYDRMVSERNRIASAYRSFGEGRKQEILGQLDNERRAILSRAYEESETIRGEADAEAASIYSGAYSADPEFFEFWRSVESYRRTLPRFRKTLTTDLEYFDFLYSATP
jgi:membrane protease subunit HflC